MSDVVSFAEIEGQHVELLPTRTLLQLVFSDPITLHPELHNNNVNANVPPVVR